MFDFSWNSYLYFYLNSYYAEYLYICDLAWENLAYVHKIHPLMTHIILNIFIIVQAICNLQAI